MGELDCLLHDRLGQYRWRYHPDGDGRTGDDQSLCYLGLAYSLAGRRADASKVFGAGGNQFLCAALKGYAMAQTGELTSAQRVWSQGLEIGPDLPSIYLYRGRFEANHGDFAASETDLRTAHSKAPHWADPLKAWGDLLAKKALWDEALLKYDEARQYAPNWIELQQARGAAAKQMAGPTMSIS